MAKHKCKGTSFTWEMKLTKSILDGTEENIFIYTCELCENRFESPHHNVGWHCPWCGNMGMTKNFRGFLD